MSFTGSGLIVKRLFHALQQAVGEVVGAVAQHWGQGKRNALRRGQSNDSKKSREQNTGKPNKKKDTRTKKKYARAHVQKQRWSELGGELLP